MQSFSSRIWSRVAVSISYDDNHYTTDTSSPFNNPLVTVPKAPVTIGIIVTFMFLFFLIPLQGTYPSFHILSFLFSG